MWCSGGDLDPQWQKSDDTEKSVVGSVRYFASSLPYSASDFEESAPTRIGTRVKACLPNPHTYILLLICQNVAPGARPSADVAPPGRPC